MIRFASEMKKIIDGGVTHLPNGAIVRLNAEKRRVERRRMMMSVDGAPIKGEDGTSWVNYDISLTEFIRQVGAF